MEDVESEQPREAGMPPASKAIGRAASEKDPLVYLYLDPLGRGPFVDS